MKRRRAVLANDRPRRRKSGKEQSRLRMAADSALNSLEDV